MSWTDRTRPVRIGDTVAYSRGFLQSIACYTGDLPQARGKVTALVPLGPDVTLAEIEWDRPDVPPRVNVNNLCLASRIASER